MIIDFNEASQNPDVKRRLEGFRFEGGVKVLDFHYESFWIQKFRESTQRKLDTLRRGKSTEILYLQHPHAREMLQKRISQLDIPQDVSVELRQEDLYSRGYAVIAKREKPKIIDLRQYRKEAE